MDDDDDRVPLRDRLRTFSGVFMLGIAIGAGVTFGVLSAVTLWRMLP